MANNKIMFDVGFKVDKSGLQNITRDLEQLRQINAKDIGKSLGLDHTSKEVTSLYANVQREAEKIEKALQKAFNPKLGTMNYETLRKELSTVGVTSKSLNESFGRMGAIGQQALLDITHAATGLNSTMIQSHTILSKMGETLRNTIKWNISSAAVNGFTQEISQAYSYVKNLDSALNSIQIVTEKSSGEMDKFAERANKAAQALGSSTVAYTKGALTFYQQGLGDEEVQARTDLTTKVQNVTGLSADEAAEYVTSVLNGYKVGSEQAEAAMDKLAAVGAHTASSLAELSEGMAKVASSANAMGVTEDQLAATLSTVISVTRQDASSVGTAFKTIYARMSAIKAGTDEAEVSLGQYTQKMKEVGINVLDSSGQLRDMGEVMEEIGGKWGTMTREQQLYLAQTMAGTRQYNNLIALFDNWGAYMDSLNVSMQANGTLQKQQDIYMESTAAHLKQLKAASEGVFDSILDADSIDTVASIMTTVLKGLEGFIDGIGGGATVLSGVLAILVKVFQKDLASGLAISIQNHQQLKAAQIQNAESISLLENHLKELGSNYSEAGKQLLEFKKNLLEAYSQGTINSELYEQMSNNLNTYVDALSRQANAQQMQNKLFSSDGFNDLNEIIGFGDHNENIKLSNFDTLFGETDDLSPRYEQQIEFLEQIDEYLKNIEKDWVGQGQSISGINKEIGKLEQELAKVAGQTEKEEEIQGKIEQKQKEINALQEKNAKLNSARQAVKDFKNTAELEKEGSQYNGENLEQDLDLDKQALEAAKFSKALTDLASSSATAVFGLQSLANLPDILTNEDLSTFEKFGQIIISAGMGLPMLISGLQGISTAIKAINIETIIGGITNATGKITAMTTSMQGIITIMKNFAEGIKAGNIQLSASNILEAISAKLKIESEKASARKTLALAMEAKAQAELNKQKALENLVSIGKGNEGFDEALEAFRIASGKLTEADAHLMNAEAIVAETGAAEGLSGAMSGLLGSLGSFLLVVAEIAAPIIAIGLAIYGVQQYLTRFDRALEDAQENLGEASNNLQEATTALQGLNSELSDISSKENALDGLKKGTVEYNAALLELNQSVRDFAEEYDLAFGKDFTIEDGVYKLTDAGKATAQGKANKRVADASMAYYNADKKADSAQLDIDLNSLKKNIRADVLNNTDLEALSEDDQKLLDKLDGLTAAADTSETVGVLESLLATGKLSEESEAAIRQTNAEIAQNTAKEDGELEAAIRQYWANNPGYNNLSFEEQEAFIDNEVKKAEALDISSLSREDVFGKAEGTWGNTTSYNLDEVSPELINYLKQQNDNIGEITRLYIQNGKLVADYIDKNDGSEKTDKEAAHFNEETVFKTLGFLKQYTGSFGNTNLDNVNVQAYMNQNNIKAANNAWTGSINDVLATEGDQSEKAVNYYKQHEEELKEQGYNSASEFVVAFLKALGESVENTDMASIADLVNKKINEEGIESSNKKYGNITSVQVDEETGGLQMQYSSGKTASVKQEETGLRYGRETYEQNEGGDWVSESGRQATEEIATILNDYVAAVTQGLAEKRNEAESSTAQQSALGAGVEQEEIDELAERLEETYELDHEIAQEIAADNLKLLKGVEKLQDGYEDWADSLDKISGKSGKELQKALSLDPTISKDFDAYKESMSEILDIPIENLSDEFLTQADTLELAKEAAEGNTDAINDLYKAAASFSLNQIDFQTDGVKEEIQGAIDNLNFDDLEIGMTVDEAGLGEAFDKMYEDAGVTVDDINNVLTGIGFEPEWGEKRISADTYAQMKQTGDASITENGEVVGKADLDNVVAVEGTNDVIVPYLKAGGFRGSPSGAASSRARKGGGSGGGGKKGGGKKKGSGKAKENIKKEKSQKDVYHDINIELEKRKKVLEDLQKAEEQLTDPKDIAENLEKQKEALDKLNESYEKKIEIAKKEAAEQRKNLSKEYGAKFDEDGNISNYFQIIDNLEKNIEAARQKYNKHKTDKNKEAYDKAIEERDNFLSDLSDYEGTLDVLDEISKALADDIREQLNIKLKGLTVEIEVAMEAKDFFTKWNEFKRKYIDHLADDSIKGQLQEAWGNILDTMGNEITPGVVGLQTQTIGNLIDMLNNGSYGTYIDSRTGKEVKVRNEKDVKEALVNNVEQAMGIIEDLYGEAEKITDAYLDSIDAVIESRQEMVESYEMLREQTEHNIKMIELFHGEDAYDLINEQLERQSKIIGDQMLVRQNNMARSYEELQKAIALPPDDPNRDEIIAKWKDALENDISEIQGSIEEWGELFVQTYENSVDALVKKMNEALTNGLDLDIVGEEYDLVKGNQDDYLDLVNRAYALDKLRGAWEDIIDSDSSEQVQRDVNKAMNEQLDLLEQKGELTQSDIDRAYLELEIMKKQIALQDAQANKSKMRLRRDANGNYSYQFVSDEEATRQAAQELADAKNELYNFDKNRYEENLKSMYDTWNEYQAKIAEAYKKYANDEEKRTEYLTMLQEQYGEKINRLSSQGLEYRQIYSDTMVEEVSSLYGVAEDFLDQQRESLFSEVNKLTDTTAQSFVTALAGAGFTDLTMSTIESLNGALAQYSDSMSALENLDSLTNETVEEVGQIMVDLAESINNLAEQDFIMAGDNYQKMIDYFEANAELINSLLDMIKNGKLAAYGENNDSVVVADDATLVALSEQSINGLSEVTATAVEKVVEASTASIETAISTPITGFINTTSDIIQGVNTTLSQLNTESALMSTLRSIDTNVGLIKNNTDTIASNIVNNTNHMTFNVDSLEAFKDIIDDISRNWNVYGNK